MYRASRNNSRLRLVAAAILAALSLGGTGFAGTAAADTESSGRGCKSAGRFSVCQPVSGMASPNGGMPARTALRHCGWRRQRARIEAGKFAARIKRHLGRRFMARKQQFHRHQARIESQRRRSKARSKARQFAEARRHAQRADGRRHALPETVKRLGRPKPMHRRNQTTHFQRPVRECEGGAGAGRLVSRHHLLKIGDPGGRDLLTGCEAAFHGRDVHGLAKDGNRRNIKGNSGP